MNENVLMNYRICTPCLLIATLQILHSGPIKLCVCLFCFVFYAEVYSICGSEDANSQGISFFSKPDSFDHWFLIFTEICFLV